MLVVLLAVVKRVDSVREGLNATYFTDTSWSSTPAVSRVDARPSSSLFADAWNGRVPDVFSATWAGKLVVLRGGPYTLASESDDGSWVYVDRKLVVENGGPHQEWRRTGVIDLEPGAHDIFIQYFQAGGPYALELLWARGSATLEPIPSWAFVPRHAEFRRLVAIVAARRLQGIVLWLWLASIAASLGTIAWRPFGRWVAAVRSTPASLALTSIVAASAVVNAVGVWWGVPSNWAGDEITPTVVRYGLDHAFSGGWWDRYPPFHMQLLSVVFSPWLFLRAEGSIHSTDLAEYGVLMILGRLVSVAAAAGTVIAVYKAARDAFGTRAGVLAAASLATLTPFLYYAKTSNPEVPYVFWFSVSLVFYLRLLRTLAVQDFVGFALAAILSICTKDQAYGLYWLAPLPMIRRLWQEHHRTGKSRPLWSAVFDRRLWIAGAAAAVVFALVHNIPLNAGGFVKHVKDITGAGQTGYQMVEATAFGRIKLLWVTADLDQRSWGWPLWLVGIVGVGLALKDRATRQVAISLLLFVVAYYVGFINVVRYAFDRYVLPICVVEALFVGFAFDRWLARSSRVTVRAAVGAAFAYTAIYAITLDVLMVRDARYSAERWLRAHDAQQGLVGYVFPLTVQPRLNDFAIAEIRSIVDLRQASPAYFVLNADYARAVPDNLPEAELVAGLQHQTLGYRLAFRYRAGTPWPWLPAGHPNLMGPRTEIPVVSVLTEVNPTIEIYAREGSDPSQW